MLVKEMFSKKIRHIIYVFLILFSFKISLADQNKEKSEIINYLKSLKNLSVSFVQDDGANVSEGLIFLGKERVRVEYKSPSKILIIFGKDKAMYYNYDLDEDEFFNPKDTSAWYFYEIFKNNDFLEESNVYMENQSILVEKKGSFNEDDYVLKIYFEDNPLIIRKIELFSGDIYTSLSFFNHINEVIFDKSYFKLINPSFFD